MVELPPGEKYSACHNHFHAGIHAVHLCTAHLCRSRGGLNQCSVCAFLSGSFLWEPRGKTDTGRGGNGLYSSHCGRSALWLQTPSVHGRGPCMGETLLLLMGCLHWQWLGYSNSMADVACQKWDSWSHAHTLSGGPSPSPSN